MLTRRFLQPLESMEHVEPLRQQINRLFEDSMLPMHASGFVPPIELSEHNDAYKVRLQVPGLKPEDITIETTGNTLYIEGESQREKSTEGETIHRSEFRYGAFRRAVEFGSTIDADKIDARYKDGILTLTLPKQESAKKKTIAIKTEL